MVGKVDLVQKEVNPESFVPAIRVFHRRYSVPVVARLHAANSPLRFTDLSRAVSGASRDTLAETLVELQRAGVIERAPKEAGYQLTGTGAQLGDATTAAAAAVESEEVLRAALKKWPMIVLVAVGRGAVRFNEIKALVPGITSGALAPALKDLETAGLVRRDVTGGYPPAVGYVLDEEGLRLFPTMDELVRCCALTLGVSDGALGPT